MDNFGRVVKVAIAGMTFSLDSYSMEGTVPFDSDLLPNESEIKIWNLSLDTVHRININGTLTVEAGYRGDIGMILQGLVSKVKTERSGVDAVTTIHVLDGPDLSKRTVKEIAYAKGTRAGYILNEMAKAMGVPIGRIGPFNNFRYDDGYTASGDVTEIVGKVAKDCGTSAFINKGKLYIGSLRELGNEAFRLSAETGLIGSPESFDENGAAGYRLTSQLQYRVTTASVIDLESLPFKGRLYVRSGSHKFSNTGDFTTETEAIL